MTTKLFKLNENLFLICGGTYTRHQESTNNAYQRKSYFGQKVVPLCKPLTVCTTDGYVIDMLGPYYTVTYQAKGEGSLDFGCKLGG